MSPLPSDLLGDWHLETDGRPAYRQVAAQLARLIRAGTLAPGERLPPDRMLAQQLGLSRTTVVAAYDELKADGLVHGRQGSGTYVARDMGPTNALTNIPVRAPGQRTDQLDGDGLISLSHSLPPLEGLPLTTLTRLLAETAQQQPAALAEYLPAEGYPPLRHELARYLVSAGWPVRPAELLILSGSQQGIDLLARLLLRPGDYVAVESWTYVGALAALRAAGARLLPIPLDDDGLETDGLASLLARYPVRFIYTVPTYQNPTGATMSLARRQQLLAIAARQAVPVIEDSPFEPLTFDQPPPPSLKALDRAGLVISLASASKLLGAGLRLGWLVAAPTIIEQLAGLKRTADLQTNNLAQLALHRFLSDGLMPGHLDRLRALCQRRAQRLSAALAQHLPELIFQPPAGGLYLWGQLPGLSSEAVLEEALARGVTFMPGSWFAVNGSDDGRLRLCFASPPADLIDSAVRRLAEAHRAVATRGHLVAPVTLAGRPPLV